MQYVDIIWILIQTNQGKRHFLVSGKNNAHRINIIISVNFAMYESGIVNVFKILICERYELKSLLALIIYL